MSRIDERIQECMRQRDLLMQEQLGLLYAKEGEWPYLFFADKGYQAAFMRGYKEGKLLLDLDKIDAQRTETQVG